MYGGKQVGICFANTLVLIALDESMANGGKFPHEIDEEISRINYYLHM